MRRHLDVILFSTAVAVIGLLNMLRNFWAWPEAPWQTNFLFISDIDHLLSGEMDQVTWFDLGVGHSLNGYRWFEYFNAYFFGFNSHIETVLYWFLQIATAILITWELRNRGVHLKTWLFFGTIFSLLLLSPTGAGSRGMEIGQYSGLFVIVILIARSFKFESRSRFAVTWILVVPGLVFTVLGGYIGGWAVALALTTALVMKRVAVETKFKLIVSTAVTSSTTVIYALLIRASGAETISEGPSGLITAISKDVLFPLKFLIIGNVTPLATSQTFESMVETSRLATYYSIALLMCVCTLVILSYLVKSFREKYTFPTLLATYGFGTALTLLVYRPFGPEWLLSPWYALHFKVGLVGVLFAAALLLQDLKRRPLLIFFTSLIVALTVIAGAVGWVNQFNRQRYEREYFLQIAKAEYFEAYLKDRGDGLSQLIIPMGESREAIRIMKKHSIGVFRPGGFEIQDLP
jgi:hypothetical protein